MSGAIAAIKIAVKHLGLDEDTERDFYQLHTGKRHVREMTVGQLGLVLNELGAKGAPKSKSQLTGPYGAKLQALWLSGWNLGLIGQKHDSALLAFVKKQTGIDHTRFLRDAADARKAVEALKSWIARSGKVDWAKFEDPKDCVIFAQVAALKAIDQMPDIGSLKVWSDGQMADKEKIALMQRLGTRIRSKAGVR
jgi:phage gp16-like protein